MRTLFLNPPSYDGFDGAAGARYQAKREVRSFWYPTWLAQPAAMVQDSKLVDAPAHDLSLEDVAPTAKDFEMAVLYTSTPTFRSDVRAAEALKDNNPKLTIGFVGPHVTVDPNAVLNASKAIDYAAGNEFDFTIQEVAEGRPWDEVDGLSFRKDGEIVHTKDRAILEDMDLLPHVVDVYKRDLVMENYFVGPVLHPYVSFYTGRGCKSRCTFCLWPQTIGGQRYRTRSVEHVISEVEKAKDYYPQSKEIFFDDDTLTDDLPRVEAISREMGRLGMTWSCNAKANVPYDTLKVMREGGLRMMVVGYETGDQQILRNIKKGMRIEWAREFSESCHKLGIQIHGTFVLGLPGETKETIQKTLAFAKEVNPHTLQVSLAAAYPGTSLYQQASDEGWLLDETADDHLVGDRGVQVSSLSYPHLSKDEIFDSVADFYKKFYLRPSKILEITGEMVRDWSMMKRRLREGVEFFRFLSSRENRAS